MSVAKNILVPIDFSPYSERALDYAAALAKALGAKVHLVNAITIGALGAPELPLQAASMVDELTVANQAAIDKVAAPHRAAGIDGTVHIRVGDARDVILQTAEAIGADMIVMGTHGRRGLARALLGSVAEAIVRSAPVPVLTVRST